jgi:hypothetical protein
MYRLFQLTGRIVYKTDGSFINYDIAKGFSKPLPATLDSVQILQTGTTNLLYQSAPHTGSTRATMYLYNVVSGMQTDVTPFLAHSNTRFAFYAPLEKPDKTLVQDEKLIQATPRKLTFFDINHLRLARTGKTDSLMATGITRFHPASLTLSGSMINVKNQDDVVLCFFIDNKKNQLPYFVNHIYPKLSKGDRDAAGLPD